MYLPQVDAVSGIRVAKMTYVALALLSGAFKGPQIIWSTFDRVAYALLSAF